MARILSLFLLALALSCRHASIDESPDTRVLAIADAYVADVFEERPGRMARLRLPGARYDRLPDDSLAGVAAARAAPLRVAGRAARHPAHRERGRSSSCQVVAEHASGRRGSNNLTT